MDGVACWSVVIKSCRDVGPFELDDSEQYGRKSDMGEGSVVARGGREVQCVGGL